jgi:hypothetical protein
VIARLRSSPLVYPLLLAAYPVVFLWSTNREEDVGPLAVLTVLALVLGSTAAVWLLARAMLRDPHRASFATMALTVPFLAFGHVRAYLDPYGPHPTTRNLFIGSLALMLAGVAVAARARWIPGVARVANPIAMLLLVLNLVPLVGTAIRPGSAVASAPREEVPLPAQPPAERPDVYYLIFDRYTNERVLREQYGFDNTPFLDDLRRRGFTVIDDAVANYPRTSPSLASSLNMTYLDELAAELGPDSLDWGALRDMLDGPLVSTTFQRLGYRTVNIGSWWSNTAFDPAADENVSFFSTDEFSHVFEETTMWPTLARYTGIARPDAFEYGVWEATPQQFAAVAAVAEDPRPTFTFAHFLVPHPPYVFLADGSYARGSGLSDDEAYGEQVRYANTEIQRLLDTLIGQAPAGEEPIVVLQADEGPYPAALIADEPNYDFFEATQADLEKKQSILEALYLPGAGQDAVPAGLTPVNTFRLILSRYFGAELRLLPDRAYVIRSNQHPFEFHDVTDRLSGAGVSR